MTTAFKVLTSYCEEKNITPSLEDFSRVGSLISMYFKKKWLPEFHHGIIPPEGLLIEDAGFIKFWDAKKKSVSVVAGYPTIFQDVMIKIIDVYYNKASKVEKEDKPKRKRKPAKPVKVN